MIAAAGIDATVARPTSLSDGDFVPYVETMTGAPALAKPIPRASVADFLVKSFEQPSVYSRTSVGLAPIGA